MKFLELNKKRHAIKHFTDQPVDPKDVRTAIEIATLAPSAHNSQPWKFVVVRQKNAELAKLAYGANYDQVMEAPVTIALFTDTDLKNGLARLRVSVGLRTSQMSSCNTSCKTFLLNLLAMMPNKQVIT